MATPQRQFDALVAALEGAGTRFGFFRAVQLIQRLLPERARVGELGPSEDEAIRFRHDPNLVFHSSDIAALRVSRRNDRPRMEIVTTFFGLLGAVSPLATVFSEEVLWAEAQDESSLRSFYDVLHHRLLSLFFRSWDKYRFEAAFQPDAHDVFSRRMLAFVGVDLAYAAPQRGLPPFDLLALAPLIVGRTRPAQTLKRVLERMVPKTDVRVDPFIERRVTIPEDQRCMVALQNCTLGVDFAIGRTVLDRSGRFRVTIGPVNYPTFEALMPGGRDHSKLRDVVLQFSPAHVEAELEICLDPRDAPRFRLASDPGSRLGVTTHLPIGGRGARRARALLTEHTDPRFALIPEDAP